MVRLELVKKFPLFDELNEKEKELLSTYLKDVSYHAGDTLFNEGDPSGRIFFLVEGAVGLFRPDPFGNEVRVAVSDRGTPLGELSFFTGRFHSLKGVALKDTKALLLTKESYQKLKEDNPSLAVKLIESITRTVARRLEEMNMKFLDAVSFIWGGPKK
jgi:CRP-like cAMP-binding protein